MTEGALELLLLVAVLELTALHAVENYEECSDRGSWGRDMDIRLLTSLYRSWVVRDIVGYVPRPIKPPLPTIHFEAADA